MTEKRALICIGCPMGCPMTVTLTDGLVISVEGNTCKRGDDYARREVISPTRILTTTIPVINGECATVPVKTRGEVPKPLLLDCARALRDVKVTAPVHEGDVVFANILGTNVDVIAVKTIEAL